MRYFTLKEILLGAAGAAWLALIIWFVFSDRAWGDVFINLITDIVFAIFVVWFVEYANAKDREQSNRARNRATALAAQKFYQNSVQLVDTLVTDGVASSSLPFLPTKSEIEQRAQELNSTTLLRSGIEEQATPYGAYYITEFTGKTTANVYPARPAGALISQLANDLDQLYRDVFQLDNGSLPDEVVDSLTSLKNFSLFAYCKIFSIRPIRVGYWPEDDLNTCVFHLGVLQAHFSAALGYMASRSDQIIRDAVQNSLAKKAGGQKR